jgi:predicted small secreted protein
MKKMIAVLSIAGLLSACNNSGSSTGQKLDSLGDKLENSAKRIADSVEEKGERLKNKIEDRFDNDSNDREVDSIKKAS